MLADNQLCLGMIPGGFWGTNGVLVIEPGSAACKTLCGLWRVFHDSALGYSGHPVNICLFVITTTIEFCKCFKRDMAQPAFVKPRV